MLSRMIALVVLMVASVAFGGPVLDVVETAGDYYTITAQDSEDASIQYWQVKVDIQSGSLFSFVDLTDDGDGSGGHTNYSGASGYNRKCSLLSFYGRGGQVMTRNGMVGGLTDRLTFTEAPDGSSFTITYTEDATSADYFQDAYGSGDIALSAGELLSTIMVVIRPPAETGTFWDWTISQENVSDHGIDPRVWAVQQIRSYILDSIPRVIDSDNSDTNGPWDPVNPVSYGRATVDANTLGLTYGREFVVDFQSDLETITDQGNSITTSTWAGYEFIQYNAAASYNMGNALPAGAFHVDTGQLIINIDTRSAGNFPDAIAGPDQTINDMDGDDQEAVTLDGSASTTPDGTTITSYIWTEGQTEIATGANPQVTFPAGEHTIILTVTNDLGLNDSDVVVIDVVGAPVTFANAGDDQTVVDADNNGTETVTLDGSGSAWSVTAWSWSLGGSVIGVGETADVDLPVGVHTVTLNCTDVKGNTDSDDVVVDVLDGSPRPPVADAGSNRTLVDSNDDGTESLTLDGSGSYDFAGSIVDYEWELDGNLIGTGETPLVVVPLGTNVITLTVTDNDGETDSDTVTVTVLGPNGYEPFPEPDPNCGLPESLPIDTTGNQLFNTYGQSISGVVPTDLIWPTNHGDADICLYEDDKFAAASITIDDHNYQDVPWWKQQTDLHGFKVTWYVINRNFHDYGLVTHSKYGWYSDYAELYELGHDVHSHSMTHQDNEHLFTTCELHYEYGKSQELIQQKIPGNECETLGYPWGEGRATVASQYFIAARGTGGGINRPYNTDYLNTRNASTNVLEGTKNLLTGTANLSWANVIYKRGWANFMYHGVSDKTDSANQIAYLMDRRDQIWVCKFSEMARYGQERDTATLTVSSVTPDQVIFNVTDRMMDSIYNYPLTVKIRVNNDWTDANATQGGQPVDAALIEHEGNKYVLVKVVPDQGNVTLSQGEAAAGVVGRMVFYNGTVFDGGDATANAADDTAIATDKVALLPGETATFANYTSYVGGITGVMVDVVALGGSVSASDFEFKVGNDGTPGSWATGPAPTAVAVRAGAGANGADRVTITFAEGAIAGQWLQVTVKANANTGLASDDVFYFGNAPGETGNSASDAIVDATDEVGCRNHPRNFLRPAGVDYPYDHNRDGKVDATDEIIARNHVTTMVDDLELITVP